MMIHKNGKWKFFGGINPRPISFDFSGDFDPHTETIRLSYTVPKGRFAVLRSLHMSILRSTAAGPEGLAECFFDIIKADGRTTRLATVSVLQNNVLLTQIGDLMGDIPLSFGDTIQVSTVDGSSSGEFNYGVTGNLIEADIDHEI